MPQDNKHNNTSVSNLRYHFVFCPKRRRKVLTGKIEARLKELFFAKTKELGWEIIALEVMPDHVHLFISADPDVAPSKIMHALKGYTSRILRSEFPVLNTLPSLWTRSFWVSTAGSVSASSSLGAILRARSASSPIGAILRARSSQTIEKYIAAQKTRD